MPDPGHVSLASTALRLGAAALFGAIVGLEREFDRHDAGVRTHLLLGLGSALFGLLSVGAFSAFLAPRNSTDISFDPSRIASYVAAGIGFLGGGAIMKRSEGVKGLTTAASLWVVAAVGLAAGLGFWSGALIATGIAFVALVAEEPLRRFIINETATTGWNFSSDGEAQEGGAGAGNGRGRGVRHGRRSSRQGA